ncbi:ABC-three component system protein [Kitasatospora sp. NPDC004531]
MLRRLSADDRRFRTVEFRPGLNLLVATSVADARATDSRNGAGKSSVIELLHFLLGARADRGQLAMQRELERITFTLEMDWPGEDRPIRIDRRGGSSAKTVRLQPDVSGAGGALFAADHTTVPVAVWQSLIETRLFGVVGEHPGVSGRALLSFLIRRVGDHGFNEATRSFARQPEAQSTPNLAHLLGLDSDLAARYQELAARKATRDQLKKAVDDPVWGRVVGKTADLRGRIAVQESAIGRLKTQIAEFRVVPQYEEIKRQADELSRRIRDLGAEDAVDRRNLDHLEKSIEEAEDPEVRYLDQVYTDLGISLGTQVKRRFEEVRDFHRAVVHNRRSYLADEIAATRARIADRVAERNRLGGELAEKMRELAEGGALEALTTLQQALAQEEAALGALKHRYEAAQAVETSSREIEAARIDLIRAVELDVVERRQQIDRATVLFNRYVHRLYGAGRLSYLSVEAGRTSLKITPKIDSDVSQGINRMAIFCFDLTLAVLAHRDGRGPDFLVHDSHLFDGVDERQLTRALELAAEVVDAERMQYVVTINEDELAKAESCGFDAAPYVIEPRLTDRYDEGRLFGFRFDRRT